METKKDEVKTKQVKSKELDVLSEQEREFIESQRRESKRLEEFRTKYEALVKETGFAWAVDGSSTLNAPKLGVAKVN